MKSYVVGSVFTMVGAKDYTLKFINMKLDGKKISYWSCVMKNF